MKCQICSNSIPSKIIINGISKTISCNRKYCFECSPYNEHNTKKLESENTDDSLQCLCESCGREYKYVRGKGHTTKQCNSCLQSKRRLKLKLTLVEYKGGCCSKCGYNKCIDALEFHHINENEKELPIGSSWNRSISTLKNEVDKCILVCANCHREIHYLN